jgi:glycogen operon protein
VLRRRSFPSEPSAICWFTPSGAAMTAGDWSDGGAKSIAMVLSGSAQPDLGENGAPLVDDDLVLLINGWWEPLTFATGWPFGGTATGGKFTIESDSYDPGRQGSTVAHSPVTVGPRSLLVLRRW